MKRKNRKVASELKAQEAAIHEEILRVIVNARAEYNACAMAGGRYGMAEYARLVKLFEGVSLERLNEYLDLIDDVRQSHRSCFSCSMKFLAFCHSFCGERLEERRHSYKREYDEATGGCRLSRDFMKEVSDVIWRAPTRPAVDFMPS
jgi:hypothetical protein